MDRPEFGANIELRNGVMIFPEQDVALEKILSKLVQETPAHFALLTDTSGLIVSFCGERGHMDLVALGSLIASDLAASHAIAHMTNEYGDYQLVLRQGQSNNTFLLEAGPHLVLLVQVSIEVPLGWARMLVREAARKLAEALNTVPEVRAEIPSLTSETEQGNLTDLFSEALDSMWAG